MENETLNIDQLKALIRCIHRAWYEDNWLETPVKAMRMHRHMEGLFNYAGITETLVKNNPDQITPEMFKRRFGINEEEGR